jgi:hypothetical protein
MKKIAVAAIVLMLCLSSLAVASEKLKQIPKEMLGEYHAFTSIEYMIVNGIPVVKDQHQFDGEVKFKANKDSLTIPYGPTLIFKEGRIERGGIYEIDGDYTATIKWNNGAIWVVSGSPVFRKWTLITIYKNQDMYDIKRSVIEWQVIIKKSDLEVKIDKSQVAKPAHISKKKSVAKEEISDPEDDSQQDDSQQDNVSHGSGNGMVRE